MYTLMHEHVYLDLSGVKKDADCRLDDFAAMRDEFLALKEFGVTRICDVTNLGMGRNVAYVEEMEKSTGIEIISCTGCYKSPFLPDFFHQKTVQQLAKLFIDELQIGILGSQRTAKLIGEVGSSLNKITEDEHKLLTASSIAANETGKWISTHTSLGTQALEQVEIFEKNGVDLSRVIFGHIDLTGSLEYCLQLLDKGANIEFDTIGKINYLSDEKRTDLLVALIKKGYTNQLFISMDITRKSHLKAQGGIGYTYLFTDFIPRLISAGVPSTAIDDILIKNPGRVFS
ncbi:MAG: phosphotriesterase family protein [Enterovibrio sp.]